MKRLAILGASHLLALAIGFSLGIYLLPILTAPAGPRATDVDLAGTAVYTARFRRDLAGSDLLHWGEGEVSISPTAVSLLGKLAPGPDYKLYLAPEFVETEEAFLRVKDRSLRLGDVKTFDNFIVRVSTPVDLSQYNTVVVWCETFSQFISAAKYR